MKIGCLLFLFKNILAFDIGLSVIQFHDENKIINIVSIES